MRFSVKRLVERDKLDNFDQMLMFLICENKNQNIKAQLINLAERCQDSEIKDELSLLALKYQDQNIEEGLCEIKRYFSEYIHNTDVDTINSFKKFIYIGMKATVPGSETNKYYYELYQSTKRGDFTIDDIMDFFGNLKDKL